MKLFQGLFPYEAVLMVLGMVLFAVLVFALVWYITKGKRIVALLPFFLLPVIMIGYPSIESIRYEKGKIEFTKLLHHLKEEPTDTAARKKVAVLYGQLQEKYRTSNDPVLLTSFAEAQYLLGNYKEAQSLAAKAITLKPDNIRAEQIRRKINTQLKIAAERPADSLIHVDSLGPVNSLGPVDLPEPVDSLEPARSRIQH